MKATDFEYRHRAALHLSLVTFAFLTYAIDPDDIVWALVRDHPNPRLLERLLFAVATLLIGAGAALRTWARAQGKYPPSSSPLARPNHAIRYPEHVGNLLFSIGLASLAPLWGFMLLIAGESILVLRLIRFEQSAQTYPAAQVQTDAYSRGSNNDSPVWRNAFRRESGKWGLFLTMIVFTLLLRDRIAEILAGASFLLWLVLNFPARERMPR
jgi:hypothetical protein